MERDLTAILAGARRFRMEDGRELRLLSAFEVMEARREATDLAREDREKALCGNACLISRALERKGKPVFENGEAVLRGMSASEIGTMAKRWAAFDRGENPSPEDGQEQNDTLKKAWSTRITSAFSGVCSSVLGRCPRRHGPGK